MPDQGPEKVTLFRWTDAETPGEWHSCDPDFPSLKAAVRDGRGEFCSALIIPEGSVGVVLDREDAEAVRAFLGGRVEWGRDDLVRVRDALRTALAEQEAEDA